MKLKRLLAYLLDMIGIGGTPRGSRKVGGVLQSEWVQWSALLVGLYLSFQLLELAIAHGVDWAVSRRLGELSETIAEKLVPPTEETDPWEEQVGLIMKTIDEVIDSAGTEHPIGDNQILYLTNKLEDLGIQLYVPGDRSDPGFIDTIKVIRRYLEERDTEKAAQTAKENNPLSARR